MKLSIVTTLYRSQPYVREFFARSVAAATRLVGDDFEVVFVNDGSPDDSLGAAVALHREDPRAVVVDLARNFGHHKAMMTGLAQARGDLVFLIDSDLEEEPELLERFYAELAKGGSDVVYGVQARRKGGWLERLSGNVFYWALYRLNDLQIPRNVLTARLMTRRYVLSLLEYREREVFLLGLWHITGYVQVPLTVEKHSKGESTYTLRRKLSILLNSITSFSNRPLRGIFYTGAAISLVSACYIAYLTWFRLFRATPVDGWTSLIVSLWFLGGLIIFFLGVIGLYISKIFMEIKQRPYSTIRQVYRDDDAR
jgi:putative glycosyltransferase